MALQNLNRGDLITMLEAGNVIIDYTKLDGSNRVMTATLQEGVIPNVNSNSNEASDNIVIWLPEEKVWRTVKLDRINEITS